MSPDKVARVRELNDTFRTTLRGGRVMMTAAVNALPEETVAAALQRMQIFSEFTEDNDPYGLHDFGAFELTGEKFFWKIDCYDSDLQWGSADPSNPTVTTRVITLMLANDY